MSESIRVTAEISRGLTESQETALASLRDGGSFAAAARQAGVARATVYRWVQSNPQFQAAYNAWQLELTESARARLLNLADKAVEVLERALARGDEKVALKMLRQIGALRRRRAGSTDVEVLDLQNQLHRRREHRRAAAGMLHEMLGSRFGMSRRQRQRIIDGRDGGAWMAELEERRAQARKTEGETNPQTTAPDAPAEGLAQAAPAEGESSGNPLPDQEIRPESTGPSLRLAGETTDETTDALSHDFGQEPTPQVLQGWRVGMKLHGNP